MPAIERFDVPARLRETDDVLIGLWSQETVAFNVEQFASRRPQFFNPLSNDGTTEAREVPIVWSAFPATLLTTVGSTSRRWSVADSSRDHQDEYCEWFVDRDGDGVIRSVVFSTELPEYWEHLAVNDPDLLLRLYREWVSEKVELDHLLRDGEYRRENRWNHATSPGIAHLRQRSNNLLAALDIVANATVLRQRTDGIPVTDRSELVMCGGLGEVLRNSDPQIAEIVNDSAALGNSISLADPVGLYLDGLQSGGMITPDGADANDFWIVERGTDEFAVRARFAVPAERGYGVQDIVVNGRPIAFGAQIADKVRVRVQALEIPGGHQETRQPCVA